MRKAWIIVALVVTLGITLGGVGTALAIGDPAPAPAPPLEGQSLCWIVGEVTAGGENSITVEGVKVKKVVEDGSVSFERIEGTFTVMVNDETQYRFGNQTRFGNQNGFANQNRFENQYWMSEDREPSLAGILEGDRVWIAAQELENGSLLAKRVVVTPAGVPPHNLCLIRGTVINQPAEEGRIDVEGKILRRPTPLPTSTAEPTEQVFTVMVDENTKYRVPDDREPSLAGILNGDRVWIAAQELEGNLLAKRVVVTPEGVRVIRLRHALLVMNREREMMALAIPQMRIVIIAKPIKIVPFRELPFDQELLPLELPSLLEPQ